MKYESPRSKNQVSRSVRALAMAIAAASAAALGASAYAANKEGHGGVVYVCRDQADHITSERLLDLWESEVLHLPENSGSFDQEMERALEKIGAVHPGLESELRVSIEQIQDTKVTWTSKRLALSNDVDSRFGETISCKQEQLARYQWTEEAGEDRLWINRELYESPRLSNLDRAALFLHEAIYLKDRSTENSKTSVRTRVIIASTFAVEPYSALTKVYIRRVANEDGAYQPLQGQPVTLSIDAQDENWTGGVCHFQFSNFAGDVVAEGQFKKYKTKKGVFGKKERTGGNLYAAFGLDLEKVSGGFVTLKLEGCQNLKYKWSMRQRVPTGPYLEDRKTISKWEASGDTGTSFTREREVYVELPIFVK